MARLRVPNLSGTLRLPRHEQTLDTTELTGLWVSFAVGAPMVLVGIRLMTGTAAGGLGLSGSQLLLVVPIGVLLGVGLLSAVAYASGMIADRTGIMVRPALGIVGSWLFVPVVVAFLVSWTAVELEVAGRSLIAAAELLGGPAIDVWVGTLVVSIFSALFVVIGPQLMVRTWVKWFAFWAGLAVLLAMVWRVVSGLDLVQLLEQAPGAHFWIGVDVVVGAAVIFYPLVADTARFAPDQGSAASSVGAGYGVPALIALLLGGLTAATSGLAEATPVGMVTELFGSSAGVFGGVLALLWVVSGQTDQPFAYLYSASASIQTVISRMPISLSGILLIGTAAGLSLVADPRLWIDLIGLLQSIIVPVLGVFLADFFYVRRRSYLSDSLYNLSGAYRGLNVYAFIALVLGFILYQWIDPAGPAGWVDFVERLIPGRSPAEAAGVPPVMLTLAFTSALYGLLGRWRIEEAYYMSRLRF